MSKDSSLLFFKIHKFLADYGLYIFYGFFLLAIIFIGLDSFVYPGLVANKIYISAKQVFFVSLGLQTALRLNSEKVRKHQLFWPLVLLTLVTGVLTLFFSLTEINHYNNYVFNTFHVHYETFSFYYLFFFTQILLHLSNDQILKKQHFLIFLTSIFLITWTYLMALWPMNALLAISKEDKLIENLTFWIYLSASVVSLLTALKFKSKKLPLLKAAYLLLALALFFIAGEEISWGQRILNIKTPEKWAQNNIQQEITLHNQEGFADYIGQIYILTGFLGGVLWIIKSIVKKYLKITYRLTKKYWQYLIPDWDTSLFFLFIVVYNYKSHLIQISEFVETLMGMGFLIFVLYRYHYARKSKYLAKVDLKKIFNL